MSESPSPRLTRRSSSVVNRIETDKETIFFNSPDEQNADIVHEIVPEIKVAKQVFEQPGTVEKVRKVSQQIKTADEAVIIRRRSLLSTGDSKESTADVANDSIHSLHVVNNEVRPVSPTLAPSETAQTMSLSADLIETKTATTSSAPETLASSEGIKNFTAVNISSVDTPTTILSRNLMYKESSDDDTSSDSVSSESEERSPQSLSAAASTRWTWGNVCFCCWSRK